MLQQPICTGSQEIPGMVVGENAGLECKTASPYMAEKWKDGKIPVSYEIQCHHYMSVMNTDAWYIAVLIYGREFKFYKIERDDQVIADLAAIEKDFWENHVLKRVMPDPDGSKIADAVIAEYFKESNAQSVPLYGFDEKLMRWQELISVIERMETEKRQIEQELKLYMGEAEIAENERYRVSWKMIQSGKVDTAKLKADHPDISFTMSKNYKKFWE